MSDDLGRASENLITSANTGTDLIVLCLRVTETVKLGLDDQSARRSIHGHLGDGNTDAPGKP